MSKILGYLFGEFVAGYIKKIIYIGLITSASIAILTMWGSFVVAFFYFVDQTQHLLNSLSSAGSGSSHILCKFIGLLSSLGFYDALNDTKGVWLSGLAFIAARILMVQTIRAYLSLIELLKPLLTK